MVQPPVIGGDRGTWGQKLLDWIQDITGDAVSQSTVDALAAQVSGKLENTPEEVESAVASYGGPTGSEWTANEASRSRTESRVLDLRAYAEADDATDAYPDTQQLIDNIGDDGVTLSLAGQGFFFSNTLVFEYPMVLDGGVGGVIPGTEQPIGGSMRFPEGVAGIHLKVTANHSVLRNFNLYGAATELGTDDGVLLETRSSTVENVFAYGFGRDGFRNVADSGDDPPTVANHNLFLNTRSMANKGNGYTLEGADANVCTLINADATLNEGYGIYNAGMNNTFITPHASSNDIDYHDRGQGSQWINPYAENNGHFEIHHTAAPGYLVNMSGGYVTVYSGNPLVANAGAAVGQDWYIIDRGKVLGRMSIKSAYGTHEWRWTTGYYGNDELTLTNATTSVPFINVSDGGGSPYLRIIEDLYLGADASHKVGFYGATPGSKPTITGSKGGNVALESLIDALGALGLITDSTS